MFVFKASEGILSSLNASHYTRQTEVSHYACLKPHHWNENKKYWESIIIVIYYHTGLRNLYHLSLVCVLQDD